MQPKDTPEKKTLLKKKPVAKPTGKSLKSLYEDATGFSKFDPITGEKIAEVSEGDKEASESGKALANMEIGAEARKGRTSAHSAGETLKDAATGGSLSFLTGSSLLKSTKAKGMLGLAGAAATGAMSAKKQISEYNKQQAARETIAGKDTGRAKAYKKLMTKKYDTK